jgi:hypothetical protein
MTAPRRALALAMIAVGCDFAPAPIAPAPIAPAPARAPAVVEPVAPGPHPAAKLEGAKPARIEVPPQIKHARGLAVRAAPIKYSLAAGTLSIDGRDIPLSASAHADAIAHAVARVPGELRALIHTLAVSRVANASDAAFTRKYRVTVVAGMTAGAAGDITIFPAGIDELRDEAVFVRNLMHELGHTWSKRAWDADPAARQHWLDAIASDSTVPSRYASAAFRGSGDPDEDAAEATALYFLVRGTLRYDGYRAAMPARFALLVARFAGPITCPPLARRTRPRARPRRSPRRGGDARRPGAARRRR